MEFRGLRYFLAVAREGSITAAANSLNLTQPTLSRQIKELEEELGQQLFVRGSHNVSLTEEGMRLRRRAEEILELVGKTKAEFAPSAGRIGGDIYIGGGETRAMGMVAETVKELREQYPDIRYHLYSGNAEDVTEKLDRGLLDFGILIQPTDLSKYNFLTLPVKDTWGVIMPENCPLAEKENILREDLAGLPLICSRQILGASAAAAGFRKWFGGDFDRLNIVATYNLVFNAALLAENGAGYVLSLEGLVATAGTGLCFRPLMPKLVSALDIVWKKYPAFSPAAEVFLKSLRRKFSFI